MSEEYPRDWVRLVLMVAPDGTYYAIDGDREPGDGDSAYTGLERMKDSEKRKNKHCQPSDVAKAARRGFYGASGGD